MRLSLASALSLALLAAAPAAAQRGRPLEGALQAVVVTTGGWDSTAATVRRYERDRADGRWRPVGQPVRAIVGRSGLGWGTGLHPSVDGGPGKREGDGRAPAGVFRLSSAFGYAPADSARWVRLPYHATDASVECVDDARSRFYNRRVDRDTIPAPDWSSHEEMRRPDELYRLGVWVDHNSDPPAPGGGSCIFLHIWRSAASPTSGCTAFAAGDLRAVVAWLDPRARPVLVQLPAAEHRRLRGAWGLP